MIKIGHRGACGYEPENTLRSFQKAIELEVDMVELELLEDVDELVVDTGSGAVIIRVPSGLGAEIEVDTGSGGIDVDIPLEVRQVKRNYLRGILGDGRGSIRVDTGSGAIRLIGG